ncbi:Diaminopimelate epimerase-like protein [Peniophora sp. CONT]|nr:Diaminopimelate epimerase-like protein [Peniophora sp. CONT]
MVPVATRVAKAPMAIPFVHLTAFSTHIAGGNPAAVVLLSPEQDAALSNSARQAIGANFHQPMTAFVVPRDVNEDALPDHARAFNIRYFTANLEPGLCGHATLASAAALFADSARVPEDVDTIYFHAKNGVVVARKAEEGRVEIALAAGRHEPLPAEDPRAVELRAALARAIGPEVKIEFMAAGLGHLDFYCLVEVATDDLRSLPVKASEFMNSPFIVHVLTTPSDDPTVAFESRMFAPAASVPEDPVCGTAHALSTPYWAVKLGLHAQVEGSGILARQVSPRGGELRIRIDEEGLVRLAGPVTVISRGELYV